MAMVTTLVVSIVVMFILFGIRKWVSVPLAVGGLILILSPLVDAIAHKHYDTAQTFLVVIGVVMLGLAIVLKRRGTGPSRG